MHTVIVWVLVLYGTGYNGANMTVIDNISSRENCVALSKNLYSQMKPSYAPKFATCQKVRKAAL